MKIKREMVWEILQRLYDSEINICLASFWDWWYAYTLDVKPYEDQKVDEFLDIKTIEGTLEVIIKDVLEKYPNSKFTKWFLENNK